MAKLLTSGVFAGWCAGDVPVRNSIRRANTTRYGRVKVGDCPECGQMVRVNSHGYMNFHRPPPEEQQG